jgi:hypothetical protein
MYENLRLVCQNYAAHGVRSFLIARAMEDRAQLELCRDITSATNTTVCRLTANLNVMHERVKLREPGLLQQELCARVAKLNAILDAVRLEDITVANENRSLTDVAMEMLVKAGWLSS